MKHGETRLLRPTLTFVAGLAGRRSARLPHVVALGLFVLGVVYAPKASAAHPQALATFFATAAAILVALLVAVALFQGADNEAASFEVRRFLSTSTFLYIGVGISASFAALADVLPIAGYRYVFAFTLGPGGAALVAVLLIGRLNIRAQRQAGLVKAAEGLNKPKPADRS